MGKVPDRPSQDVAPRGPRQGPDSHQLDLVEQGDELDIAIHRIECRDPRRLLPQRLHRVLEVEGAVIERRGRIEDLEPVVGPDERSFQSRKPKAVEGGVIAGKCARELTTTIEDMPRPDERRLPRRSEVVLCEENLLHRGKLDLGFDHVVGLLGPTQQVHLAGHPGCKPVHRQVDAREIDKCAVELVGGLHVRRHRLERRDLNRAVRERDLTAIAFAFGDGQIDVAGHHSPRRAVVTQLELALVGKEMPQRRDDVTV